MASSYSSGMFARLVTMLGFLAIVVMTTMTSAHAVRLNAGPDHSVHVTGMKQTTADGEHSCDGEKHCRSGDVASCELLCAGLSASLIPPGEGCDSDPAPISHDLPAGSLLASLSPGMSERPPKNRLL